MGMQKLMTLPINYIYKLLINDRKITVTSKKKTIFIGKLIGFDEYMNLVLYDGKFKDAGSKKYMFFDFVIIKGHEITEIFSF